MKRLSPKFINRVIVGLFLLIPLLVYVIGYLAYLVGAHGSADISTFGIYDRYLQDSWCFSWGVDILDGISIGFAPINSLLLYVFGDFLSLDSTPMYFMVGYMWYAFHVLLFDLVFHISTFFIRLIKNILDKLEGGTSC